MSHDAAPCVISCGVYAVEPPPPPPLDMAHYDTLPMAPHATARMTHATSSDVTRYANFAAALSDLPLTHTTPSDATRYADFAAAKAATRRLTPWDVVCSGFFDSVGLYVECHVVHCNVMCNVITLYCITLNYITLHHITLHYIVLH